MSKDLSNCKKSGAEIQPTETDLEPLLRSSPSKLSRDVQRLKEVVFRQAAKRERLPQELFWSLFHSEIDAIKRNKEKQRVIRKLLYGIDL
jgi:hypothetical protein